MKRRDLWFAVAGLMLGALVVAVMPPSWLFISPQKMVGGSEPGVRWTCAMMDYISDFRGNGKCPVCGMDLHRITAGALSHEQQRRMGVQTETIVEGPASITVHAYGAARYDQRSAQVVVPRVAGRIVKRYGGALHHGGRVQVGDPLVDLYSPQVLAAQGELAAALAAKDQRLIDALEQRFERWNLSAVAQQLKAGGIAKDTVTIQSPFAGLVMLTDGMGGGDGTRLPEVGIELMADQPLLTLVDGSRFELAIHVPEQQARFLRVGQAVALASDDAGELSNAQAHIGWLSQEIGLDNRARELHVFITDPQGKIFAGSLVSARIRAALGADLEPADPADQSTWGRFPLVLKSAVLSTGVRHVAWRRSSAEGEQQHFELVSLALGPRIEGEDGNDRYIVRAGLKAGDVVATEGAFLIDSQAQLAGSASLLFPDGAAR